MQVRIDEPGADEGVAQVDHLGPLTAPAQDLVDGAHIHDTVPRDRDGPGCERSPSAVKTAELLSTRSANMEPPIR